VASPWSDLDRPPLSQRALAAALARDGGLWRDFRVVAETGSTNDDVLAAARAGAAEGLVVVAEAQTAGRGRLDRGWVSPPRAGLTFSVLVRPDAAVAAARWGWLPLLAGLAVQRAVHRLGAVPARLKWPNDLLLGADRGKAGGVLVQVAGGAAVIGIGLNVSTRRSELPLADATSLALVEAECTDRDPLLRAILRQLADDYLAWRRVGGDPASGLRDAYLEACDTVGRDVRVGLPGGEVVTGTATGVDAAGRLLVVGTEGERAVSAGDVTSVR
jgi:BirA family transcriptional regulator, biotin operon repressor / biotin---[acetyl-CoA-carboxylase] ligase